jgi:hypothetical protein
MTEEYTTPIRRHSNGTIDMEFYVQRGRAERGRTVRQFARGTAMAVADLFRSFGQRLGLACVYATREFDARIARQTDSAVSGMSRSFTP